MLDPRPRTEYAKPTTQRAFLNNALDLVWQLYLAVEEFLPSSFRPVCSADCSPENLGQFRLDFVCRKHWYSIGLAAKQKTCACNTRNLNHKSEFPWFWIRKQRFSGIQEHSAPFYGFFRVIRLDGLNVEETTVLIPAMVKRFDQPSPDRLLSSERCRVETVRRPTDGSPRLLAPACQMLFKPRLGKTLENIERLIDGQTPYFLAIFVNEGDRWRAHLIFFERELSHRKLDVHFAHFRLASSAILQEIAT